MLISHIMLVLVCINHMLAKLIKTLNVSVALEALGVYAKNIYRTLRKLKKHSMVAADIMKALLNLKSVDVVSD